VFGGTSRKRSRPSPSLFAPNGRRLVLHVGCGLPNPESLHDAFRGPEWRELRLDIDAVVRPDILADITGMPEVPSESVDAVWSSHNIEHVFTHEAPKVFGEFFRVLRPGGQVVIATPDLQRAAERIVNGRLDEPMYESEAGPIAPIDMLYGFTKSIERGNPFMAHRTGYTARTLTQRLKDVGFVDVRVSRTRQANSLWAEARRPPA